MPRREYDEDLNPVPQGRVEMFYHKSTDKAVLVSEFGVMDAGVWLPVSQITMSPLISHVGYTTVIIDAPVWLLDEKGLL